MEDDIFSDQITEPQRRFLLAYIECCMVTDACVASGTSNATVNSWRKKNEYFSIAFDVAREITYEKLEDEAMRRAKNGWKRPVYQGGKLVGWEDCFSDRLAEILLKGNIPERYKDRMQTEITGAGGVDIFAKLAEGRQRVIEDRKIAELGPAPESDQLPSQSESEPIGNLPVEENR